MGGRLLLQRPHDFLPTRSIRHLLVRRLTLAKNLAGTSLQRCRAALTLSYDSDIRQGDYCSVLQFDFGHNSTAHGYLCYGGGAKGQSTTVPVLLTATNVTASDVVSYLTVSLDIDPPETTSSSSSSSSSRTVSPSPTTSIPSPTASQEETSTSSKSNSMSIGISASLVTMVWLAGLLCS